MVQTIEARLNFWFEITITGDVLPTSQQSFLEESKKKTNETITKLIDYKILYHNSGPQQQLTKIFYSKKKSKERLKYRASHRKTTLTWNIVEILEIQIIFIKLFTRVNWYYLIVTYFKTIDWYSKFLALESLYLLYSLLKREWE